MKASADLVVEAALGHLPQRELDHRQSVPVARRVVVEEELRQVHRAGELRRSAEPAVLGVGALEQAQRTLLGGLGAGQRLAGARPARERFGDLGRALRHLVAAIAPRLRDAREHLAERGHPMARLRRVIGAAVERTSVGGAEHRERPAAVPGQPGHRVHVDLIDVGPLFAIDLDAHEQLVHERRGLGVLERLVLHHVAPVACAVADRDEQRSVFALRPRERLRAPGIPVHRVVHVLAQIGARLRREAVGAAFGRGTQGRLHYQPS